MYEMNLTNVRILLDPFVDVGGKEVRCYRRPHVNNQFPEKNHQQMDAIAVQNYEPLWHFILCIYYFLVKCSMYMYSTDVIGKVEERVAKKGKIPVWGVTRSRTNNLG
jgi:hypothetical protein